MEKKKPSTGCWGNQSDAKLKMHQPCSARSKFLCSSNRDLKLTQHLWDELERRPLSLMKPQPASASGGTTSPPGGRNSSRTRTRASSFCSSFHMDLSCRGLEHTVSVHQRCSNSMSYSTGIHGNKNHKCTGMEKIMRDIWGERPPGKALSERFHYGLSQHENVKFMLLRKPDWECEK